MTRVKMTCPNHCADSYEIVHPFHQRSICSECDAPMREMEIAPSSPSLLSLAAAYKYETAAALILILFVLATIKLAVS